MKAGEDFRTAGGHVSDTVLLECNYFAGARKVSWYWAVDLIVLQGLKFFRIV
jgi:hypothetical protein